MQRIYFVAVLVFLFVGVGSAQTASTLPCSSNCSLNRNQPFSVSYDWAPTSLNPDTADGFKLYQNSAMVSQLPASALSNGSIVFPFASGLFTPGTYVFNVSAYNSGGETAGDPITLTILKGKPAKP